ncbi:MAG: hypothetical protein HYT36_03355 [Candidatus Staskawiczbacteria bacterium]|nr:hypothetical protein [Candidatus Staskawiczbacteria bacterium]
MLSEINKFVKEKFKDIMLFAIIGLLLMLSFASGYIAAKYENKEPVQITDK